MEGAASNRVNYTGDSYSKNKEYMHALIQIQRTKKG